jgi:membrane protease YdiL (CAAX protease family)
MATITAADDRQRRVEGWLFVVYFVAYLAYLFALPETEIGHWVSLVALPALLLVLVRRPRDADTRRRLIASVGFAPRLRRGLVWAIPAGLALGAAQLLASQRRDAILELIGSGRVVYLLPLAFVLMMLTAAFTEEFFFRGVFGLFHWPYAYLVPHWPSHGALWAALQAAMAVGLIGGVLLGAVYELSGRNVLACAVVHALINAVPGMTQVRF